MLELARDYKIAVQTITRKAIAQGPSNVGMVLNRIVAEESIGIYQDIPRLAALMKEHGVQDSAIKQVELVLYGSSFVRYLEQVSSGLSAVDINNIILTAEMAGLSSSAARNTVSDLLFSIHVPQLAQEVNSQELDIREVVGTIYVPPSAYQPRVSAWKDKLAAGQNLSVDEISELTALADAGIPAAKTLLGVLYMNGWGVPKDESIGLENLNFGAAHGDANAYCLLGDYYYNKDNQKAFDFYSRPGGIALGEEQCANFRNLNRVKKHNRIQAILIAVLAVVMELFIFSFHSSVITGTHVAACIICTILNCLIVAGILFVNIKNPFQDLKKLILPLLVIFFIFVQILI